VAVNSPGASSGFERFLDKNPVIGGGDGMMRRLEREGYTRDYNGGQGRAFPSSGETKLAVGQARDDDAGRHEQTFGSSRSGLDRTAPDLYSGREHNAREEAAGYDHNQSGSGAYDNGYNGGNGVSGYDDGCGGHEYADGYADGYDDGFDDGYNAGY
jgi:hypothetical protein